MTFEAAQIAFYSVSVSSCVHRKAEDELHRCIERQMCNCDDTSGVLAERWTEDGNQQFRRSIEDARLLVESGRARNISIEAQQSAKARETVGRNADLSNAIERCGCCRTASIVWVDFGIDSTASDKASLLPRKLSRHGAEAASYDNGSIVSHCRGRIGPSQAERLQSALDFETRVRHERESKQCTARGSEQHTLLKPSEIS